MNPNTNELKSLHDAFTKEEAKEQGFEPLPKELQRAARKKLKGKSSIFVSKTSGGKLSRWAAKRRKEKRVEQKAMVSCCNNYYESINNEG